MFDKAIQLQQSQTEDFLHPTLPFFCQRAEGWPDWISHPFVCKYLHPLNGKQNTIYVSSLLHMKLLRLGLNCCLCFVQKSKEQTQKLHPWLHHIWLRPIVLMQVITGAKVCTHNNSTTSSTQPSPRVWATECNWSSFQQWCSQHAACSMLRVLMAEYLQTGCSGPLTASPQHRLPLLMVTWGWSVWKHKSLKGFTQQAWSSEV